MEIDLSPCLNLDLLPSPFTFTGVWKSCLRRRGASNNEYTHFDVTSLLSAVWKVTLSLTCPGCDLMSELAREEGGLYLYL